MTIPEVVALDTLVWILFIDGGCKCSISLFLDEIRSHLFITAKYRGKLGKTELPTFTLFVDHSGKFVERFEMVFSRFIRSGMGGCQPLIEL